MSRIVRVRYFRSVAVVVDAEKDPAERVEAGDGRGVGVARGLFRGLLFGRPHVPPSIRRRYQVGR